MQNKINENIIKLENLERDDRLSAKDKKTSGTEIEEKMHEYAKSIGKRIKIENPLYVTNLLDLNPNTVHNAYYP